jgi:hypothetical protein
MLQQNKTTYIKRKIQFYQTTSIICISIIDKCRICGTEGETIEHIISSCTVLAQSEYKKRHDIFAKIIHMNLAVKFNLLKDTPPHYIYKPESCLENDNYKLYFDRTVLTDIHIQHNRPDIIILNKQQKQAYLLDIAVPNSHNITQTYNTKINKYFCAIVLYLVVYHVYFQDGKLCLLVANDKLDGK